MNSRSFGRAGTLAVALLLFALFASTVRASPPMDLGTLGGDSSEAVAIGPGGEVVGSSTTATGETHAFLWTWSGGMMDLGTLGGSESEAVAISPGGQVIGSARTAADEVHGFSWTAASGMVDLGTLGSGPSVPPNSTAVAIRPSGAIAGFSSTGPYGQPHAFYWSSERGMVDLGSLGTATASPSA